MTQKVDLTKIYVAGHRGMVGSAIVKQLKAAGFNNIVAAPTLNWT